MHTLTQLIHRRLMEAASNDGADAGGGDGGGDNAAKRAEAEQRARDMGWSPRDQWRGNPDSWIDAPEFLQRGEQIMPILRNNLRASEGKISSLEAQIRKQNEALQAANESIKVLTNLSTEQSRQAAKDKRRQLLREQAQARTDGDTDREIEIGEQIADVTSQINAAQADADAEPPRRSTKSKAAAQQPPANNDQQDNPVNSPEYQAWARDNPWFGTDARRTNLATTIAAELRGNPANANLQGRAFFDKVTAEMNAMLGGGSSRPTTSKVEGSAGGGGNSAQGSASTSNGKTYADLPPDAKAACERFARDVVGDGRAFKTIADWRKHYVTEYFNA